MGATVLALLTALSPSAHADDNLLSGVLFQEDGDCHWIELAFNQPIILDAWSPAKGGTEIVMTIAVLDESDDVSGWKPHADTLAVPPANSIGLLAAKFEPGEDSSKLRLTFAQPVEIAQSRDIDPRHIRVMASLQDSPESCSAVGQARAFESNVGPLEAGKASLAAKDYDRAIALLTKAAGLDPDPSKQEAQELLGLAYERAGRLVQARAAYRAYIGAWPEGPGVMRVRDRLNSVIAAMEDEAESEFAARRKTRLEAAPTPPEDPRTPTLAEKPAAPKSNKWTWTADGSVGQFLYHTSSLSGIHLLRGSLGTRDVTETAVLSTADASVHGEKDGTEADVWVSSYDERNVAGWNSGSQTVMSTSYVDIRNKRDGWSLKAGRQPAGGYGLFGHFDGAMLDYAINDIVTVRAIAGSPVYDSTDQPFAEGRSFAGGGIALGPVDGSWSGTLYALAQNMNSATDRRAAGAEFQYAKDGITAYAIADYDFYFNEVNFAYATASWSPNDDLYIYGSLDYRRVPFLLASNALLGQGQPTLDSLIADIGESAAQRLALDRTATAAVAAAGFTYNLSPVWQFSLEASVADYSGTPPSGGVDAVPDSGLEYYLSAGLDGTGIFAENDLVTLDLYALTGEDGTSLYGGVGLRYPLTDDLFINPGLRLGIREFDGADETRAWIAPSLGFNLSVSQHWLFEADAAVLWQKSFGTEDYAESANVIARVGYRYVF